MPIYKTPLRDMQFVAKEMIGLSFINELEGHEDFSEDILDAVLTEAARFAEDIIFPINQSGDEEGCRLDKGVLTTPTGFKQAYHQFVEAGWPSLSCDPKYGGQGLPDMVGVFTEEMMCSANLSFGLYPGLTRGAYNLLAAHGSDALKDLYLPRLVDGTWGGTMCLTEAHCGTDLGLLRTKAICQSDGIYSITGTKIFISSGEHDLTDNILHFVLARTPDAPEGIKGVSLFLVPKVKVKSDGSLTDRNGVLCTAIEHKMGIKASSTCVMTFEEAEGYLVGELYHGVSNMFIMMNNERLGVGNQGLGIGEVAYQNALAYARDRLQGRSLTGIKCPDKPADPIIVHPDVRRMLLTMKAYSEGNRMMSAWTASQLDISHKGKTPRIRQDADDFVQLMTPVVKAFMTDCGFDLANYGVQIMGGHGYIKDYGMEQYVRDARIAQIYEGTNGVQALDLLGRKVGAHMGRSLRQFFHPVLEFIEKNQNTSVLQEFLPSLTKAVTRLQQVTGHVAMKGLGNADEVGAASTDYLRMFALTTHAYLWAWAVTVAKDKLEGDEKLYYQGKIHTARFFYTKLLPETSSLFSKIMAGSKPVMALEDAAFGPF